MKIITGMPGSGKTTTLIKRSAESGGTIVCASAERKDSVMLLAEHWGYEIPAPITCFDFLNKRYSFTPQSEFLIDDLEEFFAAISPVPVTAITISDRGVTVRNSKIAGEIPS